ncbi:MAG: Abi family protein [Bacteroidetes bacterium]|nr:MAG: Abi family protein [Bacteroidota bacterium]
MRTRAGHFFYAMTDFLKPHLTIDEQINLLEARGLIINDKKQARDYLSMICYFRLIPYQRDLQDNQSADHSFFDGITTDNIFQIYFFDRELRLLIFDMIEHFEVAFRTQLSYHYSVDELPFSNGAGRRWWFEDPKNFKERKIFNQNLRTIDEEIERAKKESIIRHYHSKYTIPKRPPSWITFEVISLGLLSKIFRLLKLSEAKKTITKNFNLYSPDLLESWLHTLTYVRNICAHHGRLWNRTMKVRPQVLTKPQDIWISDNNVSLDKIYISLCCGLYLLRVIDPKTKFVAKFNAIVEKYPEVDLAYMGFPIDWRDEPFWNEDARVL